jgi:hypothetical protein
MSQNGQPDGTKTGRGSLASKEVKDLWTKAYQIYQNSPGDRFDKKRDRTMRIDEVARQLRVTRKIAKRRIKNFEGWQKRLNPSKRQNATRSGNYGRRGNDAAPAPRYH